MTGRGRHTSSSTGHSACRTPPRTWVIAAPASLTGSGAREQEELPQLDFTDLVPATADCRGCQHTRTPRLRAGRVGAAARGPRLQLRSGSVAAQAADVCEAQSVPTKSN